jgi:inositol 1,4,5-triphosphate receptor type 1
MMVSAAIVITVPRQASVKTLIAFTTVRLILSIGPEPTLILLGTATVRKNHILRSFVFSLNLDVFQVFLKGIHLVSIMGNQGTFTKNFRQIATNFELLYHLIYLAFCVLALFMHPFFYSVLVNDKPLTCR